MDYWSLSHYIKTNTKEVVKYCAGFEKLLINEAKRQGCDGVCAGHIHHACHKTIDGIEYYNCGSFVEHCNAIVEHYNGNMELLNLDDII